MANMRVLKLGGSLLLRCDWPQRLRCWIASQPPALNLMIVGGGEIVEAVRELDRSHHLDAGFAHWLCIDLLAATLRLAAHLLPEVAVIDNAAGLQQVLSDVAQTQDKTYLVSIAAFYSPAMRTPLLPEDWTTTSDALAAWLARQVQADELVLFKSVDSPQPMMTVRDLADSGIIDHAMVEIVSSSLPLRLVNLAAVDCADSS